MPRFWRHDVMFFANLLGMFPGNARKLLELKETVGEVDSYGGRLVPVLSLLYGGEHNTLILEHRPAQALCRYFADTLGLRLPRLELLPHEDYEEFGRRWHQGGRDEAERLPWLAALRKDPARQVDGYVTDETLEEIAHSLHKPLAMNPQSWWKANNKLLLHRFLQSAGLPVIATEIVNCAAGVPGALRSLARQGFRSAVLKSQIGASGVGMKKLPGLASRSQELALEDVPDHFFLEGEIMVQGWLEPGYGRIQRTQSPSVQFFVDGTRTELYDVTEQILSGESVHQGNLAPPPYLARWPGLREELLRQAGAVSQWLVEVGFRGTGSVDFLVAERAGDVSPAVFVCEANARVTGATYPSVLARRFAPRGAWLMRNLRLSHPLPEDAVLARLQRQQHLFEPHRDRGVLPVNVNFGEDELVHKGQFLCLAPTARECFDCLESAQRDLLVDTSPLVPMPG